MNKEHHTPIGHRFLAGFTSIVVNAAIFLLIIMGSGSNPKIDETVQAPGEKFFCRYIDEGRFFQVEVEAEDWMKAEERVCGSNYRNVVLGPLLLAGAKALTLSAQSNPIILAQRESCSCSSEERIPILQDIGIVEAPRLGAETRKTALPRIINTPEPTQENVITTEKRPNTPIKPKDERKTKPNPTIDDLLNAASDFDDARPVSDVDPGGSLDGSRLSKSTTGKGDPYLQKIKAKLDNTMNAPATLPKSQLQKLSAKLWIKVGDNGVVWAWSFTQKSGEAAFDKMIEMNMKQFMLGGSMRFAPPPEAWKLQTIPITVEGKDIR